MPRGEYLKTIFTLILAICIWMLPERTSAQTSDVDQSTLGQILSRRVNGRGWVDYDGLRQDRAALRSYLDTLRNVEIAKLPSDAARLAFWINAYNAFTLNDVLEYVDGKTDSVRKVSGFFDGHKHPIAGESLTLDEIEKRGRNVHDPRIHFATNCASTSCPKLQPFAYIAGELNRQLELATREFFADPSRGLRLQPNDNAVFLSPILEWYAGDFNGATTATGQLLSRARAAISGGNVIGFVAAHTSKDVGTYIREKRPTVKYMHYDWTLNSQRLHPEAR